MKYQHCRIAFSLLIPFSLILVLTQPVHAATWKEQILYSFQDGTDSAIPTGTLIFDKQGNVYGASRNGGSSSCRSLFECGTAFMSSRHRSKKEVPGPKPYSTYFRETRTEMAHRQRG